MKMDGNDSLIIFIILESQIALCAKSERMIGLAEDVVLLKVI
jgi:hypothetical protein